MNPKKRVLILTADAGFGHRSATNAIAEALELNHGEDCEAISLNPLYDRPAPAFMRKSMQQYDKTVRNDLGFYEFTYRLSDSPVTSAIVGSSVTVILYKVMRDILEDIQPDAILSTYHMYNGPLGAALALRHSPAPLFTVITDLMHVHKLWFQPKTATFFVPTPAVRIEAILNGVPPEKIVLSGIPVNPQIAQEKRSKAEIRRELGWDEQLTTILAVGSRRVRNMLPYLERINGCGYPVQLAVVAGGDDDLYNQFRSFKWKIPVHIYNYVNSIPAMLHAADILLSKAGGLILAESLACGLPVLMIDSIPGQETGNIRYIRQHRAGIELQSPEELDPILEDWLGKDHSRLKQIARNSSRIGKPEAAYRIAEIIWQSVQDRDT